MKVTVKGAFERAQETSYPLIAVHRGSAAGVVISNTELGARASLAAGGDMVELDVARSSDGVYFSFHDTYEPILLGESRTIGQMTAEEIEKLPYYGIQGSACGYPERYSDTLASLPGVLINVDRSYRYWEDGFLDDLATWADPDCVLIKSDPSQEKLADLGATVIQTEWPSLLRKYLNSRCRN